MRDPDRIEPFLREIEKYWKDNPDLRFGQIVINAVEPEILFYLEDDQFLNLFRKVEYGR